jgi:hypothetical protein
VPGRDVIGRNRRLRWRNLPIALAFVAALLPSVACERETSGTSHPPLWGLVGPYDSVDLRELYQRGVRVVLLEMSWAKAEPAQGRFDRQYLFAVRAQRDTFRTAGFKIVLNFGMQHAPSWLLSRPNARFTNQHGQQYLGHDVADLVFGLTLRPLAERYTEEVFAVLGIDFYAVRVGGGPNGELSYPEATSAKGGARNEYWAFSNAAASTNPLPDWRPCQPSPQREAERFLDWYLGSLVGFQTWQIDTVRRFYPGTIAGLYPSWGVNRNDIRAAIADDLCGSTAAEESGDLPRGYDHARQIAALPSHGVAAWATWTDNRVPLQRLATLARARRLPLMGENSGADSAAAMRRAVADARRFGLAAFLWVRAPEAYCFCQGYATIDEYTEAVSAASG